MKIARFARNVLIGALVVRVIARRRAALARERRVRRIMAPLLITAGGAGVILAARPFILGRYRRPGSSTENRPAD